MKCGAIDIGTNSCRLLIAELEQDRLLPLHNTLETTRIGEGLNHSGMISEAALARNLRCLSNFRHAMQTYGVERYRAIATSAVRDADNGQQFIDQAMEGSSIKVDIVSGEEEARLSYLGVEKGLTLEHSPLVVDLGGGSIEFICNDQNFIYSLPLGAVRATELNMSAEEIDRRLDILEGMQARFQDYPLIFVGGTASSLAAIQMNLEVFDTRLVHGHSLTRDELKELYQMLNRCTLTERQNLPGLQPERADIIVKGALIILMTLERLGKQEMTVSESDLLQGMIWSGSLQVF